MLLCKNFIFLATGRDNIKSKLQIFQEELRYVWRYIFNRRRPVLETVLRNNLSPPAGGNRAQITRGYRPPMSYSFW
jgi:hypothetical protein